MPDRVPFDLEAYKREIARQDREHREREATGFYLRPESDPLADMDAQDRPAPWASRRP